MKDCDTCGDTSDPDEMCRKCFAIAVGVLLIEGVSA